MPTKPDGEQGQLSYVITGGLIIMVGLKNKR